MSTENSIRKAIDRIFAPLAYPDRGVLFYRAEKAGEKSAAGLHFSAESALFPYSMGSPSLRSGQTGLRIPLSSRAGGTHSEKASSAYG